MSLFHMNFGGKDILAMATGRFVAAGKGGGEWVAHGVYWINSQTLW